MVSRVHVPGQDDFSCILGAESLGAELCGWIDGVVWSDDVLEAVGWMWGNVGKAWPLQEQKACSQWIDGGCAVPLIRPQQYELEHGFGG